MTRIITDQHRAQIMEWWFDRTIRLYEIAQRLCISERYLAKIARELGLPDRRAHQFRNNMPVRIRGVDYVNPQEAAATLGVAVRSVYTGIFNGRPDSIGIGRSRKHNRRSPHMCRPVTIGPFSWEAVKDAAEALQVSRSTLSHYLNSDRTDLLMALAMRYQARMEKSARKDAA